MKPFILISFIAAVGLLAAVTGVPRSQSISTIGDAGTGGTLALQDMHSRGNTAELPVDDFDDRSLVFSRESKR